MTASEPRKSRQGQDPIMMSTLKLAMKKKVLQKLHEHEL